MALPGLPSALVAEFAGYPVAGLPFFSPETVTTDHGSVYRNHHLVEVERKLGCNVHPARALRPPDKHAVERAFGAIRTLLFEHLPGCTGVDAADRGAAPEGEEVLTPEEMEHLVATWIVGIWQRRHLGEYASAWDVGGSHSPNTLFAASFEQTGLGLRLPQPDLYYELLPSHPISVLRERGVKIRGLWYYGDALEPYLNERSARGGKFKGRWCVHREPRDRRTVFFQDPLTHDWHELRWTGLPRSARFPRSATGGSRNCWPRHARQTCGPARMPNCCPCCWRSSPPGSRSAAGRRPPPAPSASTTPGTRPRPGPQPRTVQLPRPLSRR
ncbi:hypothetical protein [Streptomyces sp. NBC_00876]|uniref:hypothetical protein n=1 Tax=Streptomyces sp. NBC_00876 TaxID=2975853 RepID=UPI002F915DBB